MKIIARLILSDRPFFLYTIVCGVKQKQLFTHFLNKKKNCSKYLQINDFSASYLTNNLLFINYDVCHCF